MPKNTFFTRPLIAIGEHGPELSLTTKEQFEFISSKDGEAMFDKLYLAWRDDKPFSELLMNLQLELQSRVEPMIHSAAKCSVSFT